MDNPLLLLVRPGGFEPPTSGFVERWKHFLYKTTSNNTKEILKVFLSCFIVSYTVYFSYSHKVVTRFLIEILN